jgi:hypothetical protein
MQYRHSPRRSAGPAVGEFRAPAAAASRRSTGPVYSPDYCLPRPFGAEATTHALATPTARLVGAMRSGRSPPPATPQRRRRRGDAVRLHELFYPAPRNRGLVALRCAVLSPSDARKPSNLSALLQSAPPQAHRWLFRFSDTLLTRELVRMNSNTSTRSAAGRPPARAPTADPSARARCYGHVKMTPGIRCCAR